MTIKALNEAAIFNLARKIAGGEVREDYLQQMCGEDEELRARVYALLEAHEQEQSFLSSPAGMIATTDEPIKEGPGAMVGPYKLLEQIGEGGFGLVFMAEQQQPVRRKVAVKILKPGMDTRQVIARFEAERQALALMDHTNIARVLDAGATETGRPYFAMELIRGVPITDFCDQNRLTTRERLELFAHVCQAVQHAHHKGIIHRDIKPSNVMVTLHGEIPVVKVIDFGIAKALGQQLTDKTLYTGFAQMVGTPMYMSPEQAQLSGLDIDTRSDVYSLGVLLYELLTGMTPFDKERLQAVGYDEMRRIIREEESPKPSTRVSTLGQAAATVSERRRSDPKRLSQLLRGELDWIVMKALDKDRNRRYESANGLAQDIQRYLNDEAVQACPASAWYRFRKFARRKKAALAFAACLLVMLSGLTGSLGWVARDRALRQSALEREVNRAVADAQQLQEQAKWPQALAAAQRARGLLAGTEIHSELRQRLDDLEADLVMVLRLEEIHGQPAQPDFYTGEELDAEYAKVFREYGIDIDVLKPEEAAERIRCRSISQQLAMALDDWAGMRRRKPADQSWKTLVEIARAADPDEWRTRFRDALLRQDRPGLKSLAASVSIKQLPPGTLHLLGSALIEVGALDKGMALLQDAQQQYPGDFWLNDILAAASVLHFQPPRLDDALRYYTAALAVRPDNYRLHEMVGQMLWTKKSFSAALVAYSRGIELKPDNPNCWTGRGNVHAEMGQQEKAVAYYTKAIELDPTYVPAWYNRGLAYGNLGQPEKAIGDYSKAIEVRPKYVAAWINRGSAYDQLGQQEKAIGDYSKAIELDPKDVSAWFNRGVTYCNLGQFDRAIADCSKAIELEPKGAMAWHNRGNAHRNLGQMDKAIADYSKAIELDPMYATAWNNRGTAYTELGEYDRGIADCSKAIELDPKEAPAWNNRGYAYHRQGQTEKAIADFSKAIELDRKYATAWTNRAECYQKLRQWDKALADHCKVLALAPNDGNAHNNLAWLLATCPEQQYRDPGQAVELAKKAVELAPKEGIYWNTLGVAHYRHDDWQPAIEALNKSMEIHKGDDANDWFFLAMACWQQGDKEEARKWHGRAIEWMEKHKEALEMDKPHQEELRRFRAEAAELIRP